MKTPEPTDLKLPDNFQFSQGSLQAYSDCPRLFQLRYVRKLAWPAPEVEPVMENEHYMHLGSDFHRLVQQFYLGIPAERLLRLASRDERLFQWWQNFRDNQPDISGYAQHREITLSTSIGDHRLVGKYDLIVVPKEDSNQKVRIFDWKTSRKLPKRDWQKRKLQTRVYPYLLAKAGETLLHGNSIDPNQIEMIYWFSSFPTQPMKFDYDQARFDSDEKFINGMINEIKSIGEVEASKTEKENRCLFCVYRSLCNRGVSAGTFDEFEDDFEVGDEFDFELDFEQIAEIEF